MVLAQAITPPVISLGATNLQQARALVTQTSAQIRQLETSWSPRHTVYTIGQATKIITMTLGLASMVNRRITDLEDDEVIAIVTPQLEAMRADIQSELVKKIQPNVTLVAAARTSGDEDSDVIQLPTLRRDILAYLRVLEGILQSLVFLIEEEPFIAGLILIAMKQIDGTIGVTLSLMFDVLQAGLKAAKTVFDYMPWILGGIAVALAGGWAFGKAKGD